MAYCVRGLSLLGIAWLGLLCVPSQGADDLFLERVQPIFERRCVTCHNENLQEGSFSLSSKGAFFESGYVVPGDVAGSYVVDVVTEHDGKAAMPKDGDPLTAEEV